MWIKFVQKAISRLKCPRESNKWNKKLNYLEPFVVSVGKLAGAQDMPVAFSNPGHLL